MKNAPNCAPFLAVLITLGVIDSVISNFVSRKPSVGTAERNYEDNNIVRINLPFKDQVSANSVRRQLRDLSNKIGLALQPVFVSKKLEQHLKPKEAKPSIVNQQCVVYHFVCDLCDADYVGCIQPDTFFNVSLNTKIWQLASIFMKRMVGGIV